MIAVAIPRCEASLIDEAGDVSGAGEVAGGGHTSGGSAAPILPFLELLIGSARGSGASGATYAYDPFGEPSSWTGSRYRYTEQLMIPEAQLYSYKARVYDPGLGRFFQTDPVGYQSDVNLYAYAGNDPVNGADPSGMDPPPLNDPNLHCIGNEACDPTAPGARYECTGPCNSPPTQVPDFVVMPASRVGFSAFLFGFGAQGLISNGGSNVSGKGPQSNFKLPPCGNGTAAKIADWAEKLSVGTSAIAVTSGALGLITAPSGAGFVGFEAVVTLSGGASALASGVGAVAHFANGDYVGAALDAGSIIGSFAAGKLAGGAIASTRTFNNLTASQVRQVNILSNSTGTTIGAASSLYRCIR